MEFIGSLLSFLVSIALVVLGVREADSTGTRTRAGKMMIVLGVIVLLSTVMMGWTDLSEGYKAGKGH